MKYLILTIPSEEYAKSISKFLYALSVPDFQFGEYYFVGWIKHPATGQVALKFPDTDLPIHKKADAKKLVDQVRQAITAEEATAMEVRINQGGSVKPVDFIPTSLSTNIITQSEAKANGWFDFENN